VSRFTVPWIAGNHAVAVQQVQVSFRPVFVRRSVHHRCLLEVGMYARQDATTASKVDGDRWTPGQAGTLTIFALVRDYDEDRRGESTR